MRHRCGRPSPRDRPGTMLPIEETAVALPLVKTSGATADTSSGAIRLQTAGDHSLWRGEDDMRGLMTEDVRARRSFEACDDPTMDDDGNIGVAVRALDVCDRQSYDTVISQTLGGKTVTWNRGAQRMYGYTADDINGMSVTLFAPSGPEDALTTPLLRSSGSAKRRGARPSWCARMGRLSASLSALRR
jgi:PAS domain-containing protein